MYSTLSRLKKKQLLQNFALTENMAHIGKKLAMQNIVSVLQQLLTTSHSILLKDLALVSF